MAAAWLGVAWRRVKVVPGLEGLAAQLLRSIIKPLLVPLGPRISSERE